MSDVTLQLGRICRTIFRGRSSMHQLSQLWHRWLINNNWYNAIALPCSHDNGRSLNTRHVHRRTCYALLTTHIIHVTIDGPGGKILTPSCTKLNWRHVYRKELECHGANRISMTMTVIYCFTYNFNTFLIGISSLRFIIEPVIKSFTIN